MNSRIVVFAAVVLVGILIGPVVIDEIPSKPGEGAWLDGLLSVLSMAVGSFLLLALLATNGKYKAMVRAWSLFALLGTLLLASGMSAAVRSIASISMSSNTIIAMAGGVGLLVGIGAIKLVVRRGKAKNVA